MEWILLLGFTAIFSFIILKWNWFNDDLVNRYIFVLLFCLKIGAGIFAGQLYQSRYGGGDSWTLFNNSKILTNSVRENPADFVKMIIGVHDDEEFMEKYGRIRGWNNLDVVYNDNRTVIRLNAIIGLFSQGFYNVHVVFFAFLSFMGLIGLFKAMRLLTNIAPLLLILVIFLIPGVMFWLSMASKESILIFAMGMLIYHCIRLLTVSNSFGNMAGMFFAGFLFIHIKAYLLVFITPCLLAFTWVKMTNDRYAPLKYLLIYGIGILIVFNIDLILPEFNPANILAMKRQNFEAFADAFPKDMGSYIRLPEFSPEWSSIFTTIPAAFYAVLARPYLWEANSFLIAVAGIENAILMLFLLYGIITVKWQAVAKNQNLLMFCMFFTFSVFVLIGLTTPSMGAIVRYKVPVLPFLCMIPLLLTTKPKN